MKKSNLLVVGSTLGVYGGLEAFMMAVANAAEDWSEFNVKLAFKMVGEVEPDSHLREAAKRSCRDVYFINRGSKDLFSLIKWSTVLHVQNMPPDIVFPAFLLQKKVFLTVHNRRFENFSFHNLIWKASIRLAEKRWFNSSFVQNTWEPKKKLKNSSVIPTVCELPKRTVPYEDRKGFLFVGRWIDNKGIEEILEAYAFGRFDPDLWPLTILGDGPIRQKIIDMVADLGLGGRLELPGFVSLDEKEKRMASAKWLLAPANTKEDLGLTPIEARSIGVPAIVTDDGGLPESGGPGALIARPGDFKDLARCMTQAIEMTPEEYERRSLLGQTTLKTYLKDISFYREEFRKV